MSNQVKRCPYTPIPEDMTDIVKQVREWLSPQLFSFFRHAYEKYGTLCAVLMVEGTNIPHPIHFREGMAVRNKLRELTNGAWTSHEYDERWEQIVLWAIR